ncbi:unnamed protein product [Prorocentrum cordatum]|uniref:Solute carrier family 40 protein n=1 Tax=Prorocentrum cordatum TaxID=2364126 RepID=A0ABN9QK14_9DINO|nr:unnamed protein product [Polarella glacialis]|mmetsp:Transcript_54631/g.155518  ORF Transcript_54631/g.155518 Transcript_54631/m.155518 type:complete len:471 (-) Transcript_54631:542-1954(-)
MPLSVGLEGAAGRGPDSIAPESCPEPTDAQQPASTRQQWRVVLVVALNSMLNAFVSMNTSSVEREYARVLNTTEDDVAHLYSYFLFTVMLGMTPGMIWATQQEGVALCFSVCANVSSTWIRWLSVNTGNYGLCLLSTVVSASGAWTILSLPAQITHQRFPPDKGTLTTSIMIQANYFGWLLGAFIPPHALRHGPSVPASLKELCFAQAVVATPLFFLFFLVYRPVNPSDRRIIAELHQDLAQSMSSLNVEISNAGHANSQSLSDGGFKQLFKSLVAQPTFALQVLACGLLGGISFALPSSSVAILEHFGFLERVSSLVNVGFIGTGIVAGLLFGKVCNTPRRYEGCLKIMFVCSAACLTATAWLASQGFLRHDERHWWGFQVFLFLSAVTGMSSIGFIGVGIQAAALYPADPGYVCWAIEIIIQGLGGGLNFWSANKNGFVPLAATAIVATTFMYLSYACHTTRPLGRLI